MHGSSFVDSNRKYNRGCVTAVTVTVAASSLVDQFIVIYFFFLQAFEIWWGSMTILCFVIKGKVAAPYNCSFSMMSSRLVGSQLRVGYNCWMMTTICPAPLEKGAIAGMFPGRGKFYSSVVSTTVHVRRESRRRIGMMSCLEFRV